MYTPRIGHAHLKVRNLDRAVSFYTTLLHMREQERIGDAYVFLTGSDLHHEIALQNVGPTAPAPPAAGTGLYHVAFEVASKRAFAEAYLALLDSGIDVATVDHYISWAMYFDDPDGNGLEIYCDTRREPGGRELWHGDNRPLSAEEIRAQLGESA